MCKSCWKQEGSPSLLTPVVQEAARAIAEVYRYSPSGGRLHIVIDDWNAEDDDLAHCRHRITTEQPTCYYEASQREAEAICLTLLEPMSLEERYSALALHDGFIGEGAT